MHADDERALLIHRFAPLYYSSDFQKVLTGLEAFYRVLGDPMYEDSALAEALRAFLSPEGPTTIH